jgi:hypothetical protein
MRKIALISIVLTVILAIIACQTTTTTPKYPTLNPDWSKMTVTATGEGAPPDDAENDAQAKLMACRSARMDAYRNLAEKIYKIEISGNTCVRDYITRDDRILSSVRGFIKKARVIEIPKKDGSCEVTVELYLGKKFVDIIMR